MTSRHTFICIVSLVVTAATDTQAHAQKVYAGLVIYDLKPGVEQAFVQLQQGQQTQHQAEASFINDRVLKSLDPLTAQYLTYARFSDLNVARAQTQQRIAAARNLCRRDPEVHIAHLSSAYSPKQNTKEPTGKEFGVGATGQTGHLGLFVPFPSSKTVYDDTLHEVKVLTANRTPDGYIGDDLLTEVEAPDPKEQTPYSPRAIEKAVMSINYGEYKTVENAEDAYIARQQARDPRLVVLERNFYSALQVPTRFYLFQVISNTGKQ